MRCHGEIESFLEDRCKHLCRKAEALAQRGKWSIVSVSLIHFYGQQQHHPDKIVDCFDKSGNLKPPLSLFHAICDYAGSHTKVIEDNQGVKERNILSMFLPLGVDPNAIRQVGIYSLNDLGELRGRISHNANTRWSARSTVHPTVFENKVDAALDEVRRLIALLPHVH